MGRVLQRDAIRRSKQQILEHIEYKARKHDASSDLVSSESKLKRINHAVMSLKIEPKRNGKTKKLVVPRPDDIYTQCMQQLQKVIAQSEHELAELRVKRWLLRHRARGEYQREKREL